MNEKVFIIGIELNNTAAYEKFEKYSFGAGLPFKILDGLYCVKAAYSTSSEQIRNTINSLFHDNCQVFVMKSSIDLSWRLPDRIGIWLKNNI